MVTQSANGTVTFKFFRPEAFHVGLAGDFNGWQTHTLNMNKTANGWFECRLTLAPGTYRFRYCADGCWHTDYAAFGVEPGPFGYNSILNVEPARIEAAPPPIEPTRIEPRPARKPSRRRALQAA
jgi:1,4-alpha-glucan branching enzyme